MTDPGGALAEFVAGLPFPPDRFQQEAFAMLAAGESVVVTAPTGAGKTVVAEAAVHLALEAGRRAFYTTPIKALSNQKYGDFRERYGVERVGLLTGDNVINGDAPLVVMTTEVLRNMIYADSAALDDLGVVVLDEVHYLQDRYRGAVWEEVIIHLRRGVQLVSLSATIANPREFTDWITERRGPTGLVVETHRPVPLESLYMVRDKHREHRVDLFEVFARGSTRPNPEMVRLLKKGRGRFRRFGYPSRLEVVTRLGREGLLPAIYFIFSRAGCEQATRTVAEARLDLTTEEERRRIRAVAEELTAHLPDADLGVLGFAGWLEELERGVAAHHAGMVPAFKEAVEDLFRQGLLKVVFATETLALGINMPARTVVLERLTKFTGEAHEVMQPGDYTQLTGRAGRRGIDTRGSAVVLYSRDLPFERVAAIAAEGSHPLVSSFQPSYNMAVNLIANYAQERAEALLSASFAEFRSGQRRAALQHEIAEREAEVAEFRTAAACEQGDIWAYAAGAGKRGVDHRLAMRDFVQGIQEGDVLRLSPDPGDRWVVLARGFGVSPRLLLVSASGRARRVAPEDLGPAVGIVGSLPLPDPVRARDSGYQRSIAVRLRSWSPAEGTRPVDFATAGNDDPVAACPRLIEHLGWVRRAEKGERDLRRLRRRLDRSDAGTVARFHGTLGLLEEWGYTAGWSLTERGDHLRFVYNERDLLLAESIEQGDFDGLPPAELAALASLFTYEARAQDAAGGWPTERVRARGEAVLSLAGRLNVAERRHHLPETRGPDEGFAAVAHAWAAGVELEDLFDDDLVAGDFVRNCRQLLDLLRQLRDGFPRLGSAAAAAIRAIDRGVVAAGGRI
jgi:ATP-dependent RNA helicase HelY